MADRTEWRWRRGNVTARLTLLGGGGGPFVPQLAAQTWRRASRFVDAYGVEEALLVMDRRADLALDRGNVPAACRWRDLMVAVHAMS